jgi:hypothetical protein
MDNGKDEIMIIFQREINTNALIKRENFILVLLQ